MKGVKCSGRLQTRLTREHATWREGLNDFMSLQLPDFNDSEWLIELTGADGTLYHNEKFTLRFRFTKSYPLDSPEVVFLGRPPIHPHIYSNGHICLSILYDDWSPALTVEKICYSIQSMMSSSPKKQKPPDDRVYTSLCREGVSPKEMQWAFHDDKA